jgi:hypothetical protein
MAGKESSILDEDKKADNSSYQSTIGVDRLQGSGARLAILS